MEYHLFDISELKGVGPSVREKLGRLGIETFQDLLFHLPFRYEDRTCVRRISEAIPGQTIQVCGEVLHAEISFGKRRSLVCRISDGSGTMDLRFFYFSMAQKKRFTPGQRVLCYGEVAATRGLYSIIHPELKFLTATGTIPVDDRLTPVYPVTEGVKQHTLRKLTDQLLAGLKTGQLDELLPEQVRQQFKLTDLASALQFVHRPPVGVDLASMESGNHPAKQRLAIEELLAFNLSMLRLRSRFIAEPAFGMRTERQLARQLESELPFSLTNAQQRVIEDIRQDLKMPHPMLRLVQGDVGSGKTLVAAMAALEVIEAGHQVALMAPTEILAEQHWNNFSEWFSSLGIECAFLVGKLKVAERRQSLELIASGEAKMVIGTHALFQDQVVFDRLALAIIDEQHRFGVDQRMALKDKGKHTGKAPHQLIMTATPIPRTLAMTAYADLDTSIIDELPPGRKPVVTTVLPNSRRDQVIQRAAQSCQDKGIQVYWVCTLIEESEELQCQAAEETMQQLATALPELSVGLVHGRMKPFDKQVVMDQFKAGEIDLLVATTVIEVGVDVPNANLMVIENPERLGLAQLHQLRGRVGRGGTDSHCVLMYHSPLSLLGRTRLEVMRETSDGFVIAEKDLELRGPGEVLGTRQTGLVQFKIADVMRDQGLLSQVSDLAKSMFEQEPEVTEKIIERWLGQREEYAQV